MKEVIVKTFDVYDETLGRAIIENLKTFEEAEAFIIMRDKALHANWVLATRQGLRCSKEFKHHRYLIYHAEGKVMTDDVFTKMSFKELCDEALGWRAISLVEFKF